MQRKFFPLDKNYILEQVQLSLEKELLHYLVDFVKVEYLLHHNPLGLVDETVQRIQHHQSEDFQRLHEFYMLLAGIFRYRYYGDNQLSFIFSGEEPDEVYLREWTTVFKYWVREMSRHRQFLMGILELTVFYPAEEQARFIGNRLQTFVASFFEVKIHPQKGILKSA
ncbi:MAG: hypothetical protein NZM13_10265 [Cyclobacteriaceae bacterium]|nr:hypothetical protein [Cyclobacteriaceae bacterium]MDW8332441.1 hypothetical protein [Cyclobacteriaceae bacterium]